MSEMIGTVIEGIPGVINIDDDKSYGQVAFESVPFTPKFTWEESLKQEVWETIAQAVIAEYDRRTNEDVTPQMIVDTIKNLGLVPEVHRLLRDHYREVVGDESLHAASEGWVKIKPEGRQVPEEHQALYNALRVMR